MGERLEINIITYSCPPANSVEATDRLREMGYTFNAEGKLRAIDDATGQPGDQPFVFDVTGNAERNQKRYENLAATIPEIVYGLLEECGLTRTYIPKDMPVDKSSFIFSQPAELIRPKKLLILMHGSGYVRAGQWARSLIINDSLEHGTQIPYIKKAQELSYQILITNANDNHRLIDDRRVSIPDIGSPVSHMEYVFEHIVMPSDPESVAIVAHSYGGALALHLVNKHKHFFEEKVFAMALTDSANTSIPKEDQNFVDLRARNWASSDQPLDQELGAPNNDVPRVSAGHHKHEWTSYTAKDSVFKFLEEMYENFIDNTEDEIEEQNSKKVKLSDSSD